MHSPDNSTFGIRPAVLQDLATLTAMDARCFPPGIAYPPQELAALLSRRTVCTLVAERDGATVGFASARLCRPGRRSYRNSMLPPAPAELITIDVLPEFRREGLATRLHRALTDRLRATGCESMELHVAIDNSAAKAFYARLGYRTLGLVPGYYLGSIDALHMLLLLDREPK
jgi:ribosomal-protein-alanine N-acetyltransferase